MQSNLKQKFIFLLQVWIDHLILEEKETRINRKKPRNPETSHSHK